MSKKNASTSLDLRSCHTANKLQVMPALFQQFCQSVWLCVERLLGEGQTQNEQVRRLNTQPLPGLDLVSLKPPDPIPSASPSPLLHSNQKHQLVSATASAPSAPASRMASCMLRQPSILDRAARLHDLRRLFRDQHLPHCASSTSRCCSLEPELLRHHTLARPEPRGGSVELESLVALLRSQRVLFPHLGPALSGRLLSSGISHRPTWRFWLGVVHGILRSVARFPSARHRHPRHLSVSPCFMMSALLMYRRLGFPKCFRLCHHWRRTHIKQHNSHVSHLLGSVPRSLM